LREAFYNRKMSNFTEEELNNFNAMAHDWWDLNGPCKPLHQLNPLRLDYIQSHAPLAGKKVLDVGCGGGILSEAMAKAGAQVTGLELASEVITVAQNHAQASGLAIEYVQTPVEDYALSHPHAFDVITCMEMLEHVPSPQAIVEAIASLLKPGGLAFFSTINRHPMSFIQAIVGAEYVLKILPKGTHRYAQFIKPSEMDAFMTQAGLHLKNIQGLAYNPLTQNFSYSGCTQVNYMVVTTSFPNRPPISPSS
jgi:2-polyprenyl-6-hydroxyphenyl methylase/3-demethylubiquinone-9 3-methyltransferase